MRWKFRVFREYLIAKIGGIVEEYETYAWVWARAVGAASAQGKKKKYSLSPLLLWYKIPIYSGKEASVPSGDSGAAQPVFVRYPNRTVPSTSSLFPSPKGFFLSWLNQSTCVYLQTDLLHLFAEFISIANLLWLVLFAESER